MLAAALGCLAFAHEECGNHTVAEAAGRDAVELDPGHVWATHAVAHVLEMQGRRVEGMQWLSELETHRAGANNPVHHLWWHRGLDLLELGEHDAVLELYDNHFHNLDSELTKARPDLYIEAQNAAQMPFRLERLGVDAGSRWKEIADKAEARMGDCLYAFTLPHWMTALTAAGRRQAADRMIAAMEAFATRDDGIVPMTVRCFALPVSRVIHARAKGAHAGALDAMRPAIGGMHRLGGSHAQQDVLEQVFLDCALRANRQDDARLLLERVAARHPVPPQRRAGYAKAARRVRH